MTDFAKLMPDVAKALLGEPNPKLTNGDKWRYRNKGSLSVDVKEGQWYDYEAAKGGGVIDLVMAEVKTDRPGAVDWLKREGFITSQSPNRRTGGRSARRSARPTRRHTKGAVRPRTAQKPKPVSEKRETQILAQRLWGQSEPIGEDANHPFRRWTTTGDKPGVLHPFCEVPGGIRWSRYRGGAIIAGVFSLNAWGKDGIPFGLPLAVQALAIDKHGNNRYALGPNHDLRRCSYGTIKEGAGVFILGDPKHQRVNIVEGIADSLAVYSREPGCVCATLGTSARLASKEDVVDWLCTKETWLYADNDQAGDQGTEGLVNCIHKKIPGAVVRKPTGRAFEDPGEWAERTPFALIERYSFDEKSGQFFDGGLSRGEADRLAVQHFNGGIEQ